MKTIVKKLPTNLNHLELHVASDWHLGDVHCNVENIKASLEEIKNNENAYLICNGDLLNNATKQSVSDCYSESIPPMKQLNIVCDLLEPVKNKILAITQGNHEYRTYKTDGIDLMAVAAQQLQISDVYCKEAGMLFIKFGPGNAHKHFHPINYGIYVTHGSGGGRKEGAKAIRLADMSTIIDADIYIHSHTHLPMIIKEAFYRTNLGTATIEKVTKLYVNTSSQLEYGGYGEVFEFKPTSTQSPVIYLDGTRKQFSAKL